MHEQDLAIVKGLVSVAWADGVFAEREREMLDALLEAYGANDSLSGGIWRMSNITSTVLSSCFRIICRAPYFISCAIR